MTRAVSSGSHARAPFGIVDRTDSMGASRMGAWCRRTRKTSRRNDAPARWPEPRRQWGFPTLRMFVIGAPPNCGGPGIPQRAMTSSRSPSGPLRTIGASWSGKIAGNNGRLPVRSRGARNQSRIAAWRLVAALKAQGLGASAIAKRPALGAQASIGLGARCAPAQRLHQFCRCCAVEFGGIDPRLRQRRQNRSVARKIGTADVPICLPKA